MTRRYTRKDQATFKKRIGYYVRLSEEQIEYFNNFKSDREIPMAYLLRYALDLVMSNHESFMEYSKIRISNEPRYEKRINKINSYKASEDDY